MTASSAPDPTLEQSVAAMAREMQLMNSRLAMITGWMEGQEIITSNLSEGNTKLARAFGELASKYNDLASKYNELAPQVAQNSTHTDNALHALGALTRIVGGIAELSKSTFDIVEELKKKQQAGGAHGEASAEQQAAQQ